jgi:hypothetical protein
MRYQHYKPLAGLFSGTNSILLLYLVAQALVVAVGFKKYWSDVKTWLSANFRIWQFVGIGLVFFLSSATVSQSISFYVVELFFAVFVQTINLANLVLMMFALPDKAQHSFKLKIFTLFGARENKDRHNPRGIDRLALIAALWVTCVTASLSFFVYERHPHIPDEVAYLYQARYLANGSLTMPAPPVPDAFDIYLMQFDGERWYPTPPVGWPAILAVGTFLGMPWLVNPVLAGINILLAYLFLREVYSRRIARLAVLLLCLSPWNIFMAMNFMTHTFTLTCALGAA